MAEMGDEQFRHNSGEMTVVGDLGQGDNNVVSMATDSHSDEYFQRKISEELVSQTVRMYIGNTDVTKDISTPESVSIQDLPDEMLAHVFTYLNIKERIRNEIVCRHWRWIGKHTPWTYPTKLVFARHAAKSSFNIPVTDLNDNIMFSLLSRCGSCLRHISLMSKHSDDVALTNKSIMTISLFCPNLESIKLHLRLTSDCLETLARGCPNLKTVKIFNLDNNRHDAGIVAIIRKCPFLENLEVSYVSVADDWFDVVNPKLRQLSLSECSITPVAMTNLMKRCKGLEQLQLGFCNYIEMDEVILFKVCAHFKDTLKVLKVQCIDVEDDFDWCQGLKGMHKLEELTLEMCTSVDDKLMEVLIKESPKLRLLAIPGAHITDEGVRMLQALPWLHTLDVSCTSITGEGLEVLAERGILQQIYLKASDVSEKSCCALANLCPNLQLLDVTGTTEITNGLLKVFSEAAKMRFFKNIVKLVVGCTSAMKDDFEWEGLDVVFVSH